MPIKGLGIFVVHGKGKTLEPPVIIRLPRHNGGGGEGHPAPQLHPSLISVTHSHRPVTDSHIQSQIVTDSHKQSQLVTDHRHRQMLDDSKGGVTESVRGVTDSVRGGLLTQ